MSICEKWEPQDEIIMQVVWKKASSNSLLGYLRNALPALLPVPDGKRRGVIANWHSFPILSEAAMGAQWYDTSAQHVLALIWAVLRMELLDVFFFSPKGIKSLSRPLAHSLTKPAVASAPVLVHLLRSRGPQVPLQSLHAGHKWGSCNGLLAGSLENCSPCTGAVFCTIILEPAWEREQVWIWQGKTDLYSCPAFGALNPTGLCACWIIFFKP